VDAVVAASLGKKRAQLKARRWRQAVFLKTIDGFAILLVLHIQEHKQQFHGYSSA
jgi:hypothetical protein